MRMTFKAVLAVTAGAVCLAGTPAFATTDAPQPLSSPLASSELATHGQMATGTDDAAAYWTPQRMATAVPIETILSATDAPSHTAVTRGTAGRVAPYVPLAKSAPAAADDSVGPDVGSTARPWKGSRFSPPATTSGKVFFVADDGLNYVCSGSTVNSAGKNVVFTAGHCVHGGGAGRSWFDASRWVFVPSYNAKKVRNPAPYGYWTASQLWSLTGWTGSGDRAYDIGAAVMQTDVSGNHIVNVVGGQGIEWNFALEQYIYQFGYPQRAPFQGKQLQYCSNDTYNDGGFEGINCNMTEGASGGPWLDDFDGTFGWLDSVNSWVFWDAGGTRYKWNGPYFGDAAANLYNAVANL